MQGCKNYKNVHKGEYAKELDKKTGGVKNYTLSNEDKKLLHKILLPLLNRNQELAKPDSKNKDLLMAFVVKSLYLAAKMDKE